jgi:hypothetical protein
VRRAPGGPSDQERWDLGRVRMAYTPEQLVERVRRCAGVRGCDMAELCVQRRKNRERGRSSGESACGNDGSDTCKKASQPGTKASITQCKHGGIRNRLTAHTPGASLARRPSATEGKGVWCSPTSRSSSFLMDGSGFKATAHPRSTPRLLSPTPPLQRHQRQRKWGRIPERLGFGPPRGGEIYSRG